MVYMQMMKQNRRLFQVVAPILFVVGTTLVQGAGAISWEFLTTMPRDGMKAGGILPAIVEQYQQADGSVVVPEVLRQWVGKDILHKVTR
jgi:ABC-type phosphate transport system permease subunit